MSLDSVLESMQGKAPPLGAATADLLLQSAQQPQKPEQRTLVTGAIHWGVSELGVGESKTRDNIENFVGGVATAVPLFMAGGRGMALSGVMFGLNQAKWGDTTTHQLEDIGLGVVKGLGTKAVFDHFGARQDLNFAAKGVMMGASSRGLGVALTRETWFDQNGQFQPLAGTENTAISMFHPAALATDVLTFGAAHYGIKGANWLTNGLIEKTPILQTALTGTTFGFTSGALGEVHRQLTDPKAHFDPLAILGQGGLSAAEMTIAAAAGYKFSDPTAMGVVQPQTERYKGFDWLTSAIGRAREKVTQANSLVQGQDLGMVLASGDVKGPDGEAHRSVGPDTQAGGGETNNGPRVAGSGDAVPPTPPEFRQDQAGVWKNADNDQPVIVRQYLGEQNGRHFVQVDRVGPDGQIEPGTTGIPLDEIAYNDARTSNQTTHETGPAAPSDLDVNTANEPLVLGPKERPVADPDKVDGYVEADIKAPEGFTSAMVQEGIDHLAAAATANPGSEAEAQFYDYARSTNGAQLKGALERVASEMGTDRARQLVESAYTSDINLSIPAGKEATAQAGIDLIKKMADDPSPENVRAFRQFVLGDGKDVGDVMVQAAQAMAKASNNSEVLSMVEGAYKPATEVKYDGPPELGQSFLQAYDLYAATRSAEHTADDVQRLTDFARSPEGQRLEWQMLDLAGRMEGQDGYNFMRDQVYHGSDARISVGDTGERIYIAPEKEDAARKLIGLCEGASEPNQPTWYYDYLSKAARDADPDVRNAMLEYAEKSGNEAMLITARDALVSKANVEINMTAEQAARFTDFQTVVSNRPQMTAEGIEAYKTWINQFLDANTDLQTYVKQMAPYVESSAAVDAIDQYFKTNNLDTFPVSRLRAAEIDSTNRTSDNPSPTTPAVAADAAPRVNARERVMNMPMDDLLNQLHTSPDRLTQEQAAVGAQLRLPEMTDEQFASYLQWLYAPGPDGRYNMTSIQFPNRSVLERPDVIASLTGDTVTTTDAASNAPVEHNPQFSIEALHQFLTIPPEGVPPFPAWLDAVVQRQAITGETLPNWLINDIKSRWILTNNPRLSPENPASVAVPQAVREQINADDVNQKAQQSQPGADKKKQRQAQAATAESMGNRLATLGTLLDAKTPDAVERLMQLGSQDARVLNDVVTRLQRFGQVPELRELIRLTLPQADNIYTLNIMLRSMEDASSMARKDAGRAQSAAQLAQAAADQMLPPDAADQGKVSRIIDKMAGGKYDVPRPPRKPFPGQEQKPARPERPQPPQVPFFSNDAQPIDIASVQASPAQPARKGGQDQLARSANDAASGDPAVRTEAGDFTEPPVLSSEHDLDADDRNGGGPRAPRVPDVVNPAAPDPSAKPKTPAHEFNETIPSYEEVLDNAYNNEEGAIGYSAYVSKYFKSVLTRNMPQDNLTIVVPEGYDSTPALKFIMRSGTDGQPAVVYQGRIVLETQAQAEAHTEQGKPILERPLGILVSDGNGGSRLVTANELTTVAAQISKGTYDYNREATQPQVVQKPTPQPPVKATYEQLNADQQTVLGVMRAAKNAIVRNTDGSTSGGGDKMYTMFEISRDSGIPEGAKLQAMVADLVQKGVVETDGRGLYKQTAEIQTELRQRMRQAMSGLAVKFNKSEAQPDPVVEGAGGSNGAVDNNGVVGNNTAPVDNNVVVDNNTAPVEAQTVAPAEAPVKSIQELQQDAIFDAIRDVSRQKGKGQYADVRIEDLRKVPKVDGQYVSDQIIKHWLKQWVREGLLQMKGSGYVPTTDFDAMVKQQAEAAHAAKQAQQNGGDGSGTN